MNSGDDQKSLLSQINAYFTDHQPLVLEIAAGNAQFSLQLARETPAKNFLAVDIKSDRLYTSAKRALEEGVTNIAFLRMQLRDIDQVFADGSIDELWITFPDPHPKKRSAKHRLTHPTFLQQYRKILKDSGKLKFKTDNRELFLWSLEQFVSEKWQLQELTFDMHSSELPEEYKIKTYYETRYHGEGVPINYVSCTFPE